MPALTCSLLADGASDVALIPILQWVVRQRATDVQMHCEWADMRGLPNPPTTLVERVLTAIDLYPCDVLFIHRDAKAQPPVLRYEEIDVAVAAARQRGFLLQHVCVVPVRMQEAWLLLDERAIRRASGNPNGRMALALPGPHTIEAIPSPRAEFHGLLTAASGLYGRHRKKFRPRDRARLVTGYMRDFACLRALPAFQRLETDVEALLPDLRLDARA